MTAPRISAEDISVNRIRFPAGRPAPLAAVLQRVALAVGLVVFVALVVLIGRDGYVDEAGDQISLLDSLYYASVTVTTTGYGDITAVGRWARLATILLITPARIIFLILVVGTTVEVLTAQSRQLMLARRWRSQVQNHILICGFGATGRAAAAELISRGADRDDVVAVDMDPEALEMASRLGYLAIDGDATRRHVLAQAAADTARAIVVTPNRDDTAVLITLTVRELNPTAHIVAGAREQENLHLLRQGGADEVIDATAAVGRRLGLATEAPAAGRVLDELIDSRSGLELDEVDPEERNGRIDAPLGCITVAVIRDGRRLLLGPGGQPDLQPGDRLIVLREHDARTG
ncbi:MAG: potassium channel family protein [Actinomycetota bacterium]